MKWSALTAADLFVLPSYSEGFSMAILEALGAGKPVVITKQCNFPELEGQAFSAVINPNSEELTEAIRSFLAIPSVDFGLLGLAARKYAEANYDWGGIGQRTVDVYEWMLGGNLPTSIELRFPGASS